MRVEVCSYSGFKIHPGHGKTYIQKDTKTFRFISSKSESLFFAKKKAQDVNWTVFCKRKNRKGIVEETETKQEKKTTKTQRAIAGMSLEDIEKKKREVAELRRQREAKK